MPFQPLPLNQQTLIELLNEGTERPGLDFKARCDLNQTRDKVELAKDIGAMQLHGGYIVVGAADDGSSSSAMTEAEASLFDQATLHSKVERYLPERFEVRSAPLELDGGWFTLVCVLPHPHVVAPFKADGNYEDPSTGEPKTVFRAGEIFARHGTRSERWTVEDAARARELIRGQERENARDEFQDHLRAIQQAGAATQAAASAPIGSMTWELDSETFISAVLEQLRAQDQIPIKLLLRRAPREASEFVAAGEADDLDTILDRLSCLAATLMTVGEEELAGRVVETLARIYNTGFDFEGRPRRGLSINAVSSADLGLRLIGRAWALGALAVREEQWGLVRTIAWQRPAIYDADYWQTWLAHALIMANRADLLEEEGSRSGKSVLVVAQEHVERLDCLRPDLGSGDERIITSLCQFDMLNCLISLDLPDRAPFLANFARWYSARTDPIVRAVIEDQALRAVVFLRADQELADALRAVAREASQFAWRFAGWMGYDDPKVEEFLDTHPAKAS